MILQSFALLQYANARQLKEKARESLKNSITMVKIDKFMWDFLIDHWLMECVRREITAQRMKSETFQSTAIRLIRSLMHGVAFET